MAKSVAFFLLTLLAISMLQTMVMASNGRGGHHYDQRRYGPGSLKSYRYYGINKCVLATTTGRPRKEDPSALRNHSISSFPKLPL
ncbi:hypothetical protein Dsin_033162 [Dipteronia sinensis]|uniref:Uncharacterized protein n=1 Tax=Dipteronia sinensis TaxID=43782 RepID=A0AAE0DMW8_9ROSI|nr:hypothetical protein Dsin_032996 [Dipteronia sinensis]KAK3175547.1 hypothetical protein Dsin_033188 [Dipteronia sinensis]KAK3179564.1 hypothetical protein Dsin_033162 [Dipteronia sinensis]